MSEMREKLRELENENKILRDTMISVFMYLECEIGWEFFRAEMLYFKDKKSEAASVKNANQMQKFLHDTAKDNSLIEQLMRDAHRK